MRKVRTQPSVKKPAPGIRSLLTEKVWDVELASLTGLRLLLARCVRVLHLVFKGFREDECPLHASALTFSTLMSIVPILALSLALARGLGGDDAARTWIKIRVSEWTAQFENSTDSDHRPAGEIATIEPDAEPVPGTEPLPGTFFSSGAGDPDKLDLANQINSLVEQAFEKVDNVSFGAIGGIGLGILLWMVINVLGRVEASFNRVWGITTHRALWRKFTDYLSILFVLPLLIVAASSLPVVDFATGFLSESGASLVRKVLLSGIVKHITVLLLTGLSFTFLFVFMPNTRVKPRAGLVGGFTSAILFLLWMWICASIQVGVGNAGKIYGTFAILPILLAWVYVSWQIVFFGAETAFAVQHYSTYRMEQGARRANIQARILLAVSIMIEAGRAMDKGQGKLDISAFASAHRIPVRFLNEVIDELVSGELLAEVQDASGNYVMLRSPDIIKIRDIVKLVMTAGVSIEALGLHEIEAAARETLHSVGTSLDSALDNLSIRDLMSRDAADLHA